MSDVFVRNKAEKIVSYPIESIFRKKSTSGDIGLEFEFEGRNLPKKNHPDNPFGAFKDSLIPPQWSYHHDGSLRGIENAEYVLTKPLPFDEVEKAIDELWHMFTKAGSELHESNRTSVHVHLNAQKWHLNRVTAFLALWFSVEELLTEWCGEHRVGNLFCLRGKDAPAIVQSMKKFIKSNGDTSIEDALHYAGINCHALAKFGSIEVRSLRGVEDPQIAKNWIKILRRLYDLSGEFKDPRMICDEFSGNGPMAFLEFILGEQTSLVLDNINYNTQQVMGAMYEGIRLAQDLCYCRDWSLFEPIDADPFGRSPKSVQQSLSSYTDVFSSLSLPSSSYMTPVSWEQVTYPESGEQDESDDIFDDYLEECFEEE